MIPICQAYNDFKGQANTWQQGHFRPQSFEYALYEASLEIFNILRKEWETSQVVTDAIRPFFKRAQVSIGDFAYGGIVPYPDDYASFSGLRFLTKKKNGGKGIMCSDIDILEKIGKTTICRPLTEEEKVDLQYTSSQLYEQDFTKVDSQRWGAIHDHEFLFPSLENPYTTQDQGGFGVLPKEIGKVVLTYLALPPRPVFKYTRDAKHNFICVAAGSVGLQFGQEMLPEIMSRVKTKYASYTGNQQKYAEGSKETNEHGV